MTQKTFDIAKWLETPLKSGGFMHERLCYLIVANGGIEVTGWGVTTCKNGHRFGLEQNDALDLMYLDGFIKGLTLAGIDFGSVFAPHFDAYIEKHGLEELYPPIEESKELPRDDAAARNFADLYLHPPTTEDHDQNTV